ncbi:MAG: cytochrome c family protein [Candidatus Andeanibacterium colombiense]|uniref:Cytochrome c family protein n=1 Tax=Candidatus Andeanibacterium colombiense TaxID=3121345 RepID=A0AAJ6BQF7_9SPHN|nr:MAG: cytochrome c family protein [Sphingomonadaceae bacterium]
MTDRFNTIVGWFLFSAIVALGFSIVSGLYFRADKHHEVEKPGYPIAAAAAEGEGSGPSFMSLLAKADVAKGQAIFAKCMACHTDNQGGANGIGPNLYGVVGDSIAEGRGGFAFSDALKSKDGKWTFENLDAWLTSPRAFANGTKMTFAGLSSAEDRANIVAYLNTQGSNLPLPAADAAPAAGDDKAGAAAAPAAGDAKADAAAPAAGAAPAAAAAK